MYNNNQPKFSYEYFSPDNGKSFVLYLVARNNLYNMAHGIQDAISRGFTIKPSNHVNHFYGASFRCVRIGLDAPDGAGIPEELIGSVFIKGRYNIIPKQEVIVVDQEETQQEQEVVEEQTQDAQPIGKEEQLIDWESLSKMKNDASNRKVVVELASKYGITLDPSKMRTVGALIGAFKEAVGVIS